MSEGGPGSAREKLLEAACNAVAGGSAGSSAIRPSKSKSGSDKGRENEDGNRSAMGRGCAWVALCAVQQRGVAAPYLHLGGRNREEERRWCCIWVATAGRKSGGTVAPSRDGRSRKEKRRRCVRPPFQPLLWGDTTCCLDSSEIWEVNGFGIAGGKVIISGFQQILKNEGLPGLYRGLSPTILALFPTWAVTFSVYNHVKGLLQSKDGNNCEPSVQANVLAASCAGIATATATNPLWVVKTRLQTQGMRPGVVPYQSILSALQRIAKEEGIRGLYSGLLPSLVGVAHVAIQLPVYEKVKLYFAKRDNTTVDNLGPTEVAMCSSGSKIAASIITYPHEVCL
nr:unnamed protein product [Digitaria exilis]